ncbi:Gfo/Idh/MocA family oxidoreductase [Sphingobium sp. CR2-8]|uniref:Gfo/Idh/MocA family protein n=1 Tax=Sphingobium sp. CR2-8 TaxID=1306534 RepID=UPI002DB5A8F0|nr:Gfo/Idh/MocA family oxidoreductase [Sphingobium sp. CR2-8]MEC3909148.1 Gfo/Idh/MocA family oxidoreductase [Sphingobium sp. CR2-8]
MALFGMGYWGRNIFRVLSNNPHLALKAVVDLRPGLRDELALSHPKLAVHNDPAAVMADPAIDVIVIATPVASHYSIARSALDAGKHVMMEKPMCGSVDEAADLIARAEKRGLTLMVDHTFLFHPAVMQLGQLVHGGALGRISYFDSQRVNLGLFQPDVNVVWDLAPHDLSIITYLFGCEPIDVEASGYRHFGHGSADIAYLTLHYPGNLIAHLNLSWMSPVKVRRIAIGGSEQMVVWDDLNRDEPIKIYDSGIAFQPQHERGDLLPSYRIGSVTSPRVAGPEPLVAVVEHFRRVILGQERCRTDGHFGLSIVKTLEMAQARLDASLRRVDAIVAPVKKIA